MNKNENFHNSIESQIVESIEAISEKVAECNLFLDSFNVDCISNEAVKEYLEHQHRSGYISYNRGGIELSLYVDAGFGSGKTLTKKQASWCDRMLNQVERDFKRDNYIDESVDIFDDDVLLEKFYDYEYEYLSEISLMMLQFRIIIDDNTDVITIDLSVCYGDEYYRSTSFELIADLNLSFEQFKRLKFSTLERYFKRALRRA